MKVKKIECLLLAEDYPDNNGGVSLMYIHTRNKYYIKNNINVTVLNFRAKKNYIVDGIQVITLKSYEKERKTYNVLILHAPNIKHHFLFLLKYGTYFKNNIFFFHGHEILRTKNEYPTPYEYFKTNKLKNELIDLYDKLKLKIWSIYIPKIIPKSYLVFVSNWMYKKFIEYTNIETKLLDGRTKVIYNSIGADFENNKYDKDSKKEYDYITIRSNIDGSKYCIDILNNYALKNPDKKFLLIGKGNYFKYNQIAKNITWIDSNFKHKEIIKNLNNANCAFMPTRTDAQGVMVCEMVAFGIPVITSDIEICHEIFDGVRNVNFINNDNCKLLTNNSLSKVIIEDKRFYQNNTVAKEVELIKSLV